MKNVLFAATLGLVVSVPAHAVEPKPTRPAETAPISAPSAQASAPEKTVYYCGMVEPATGSRIWEQHCKTRDAWLKQGFDPLARK